MESPWRAGRFVDVTGSRNIDGCKIIIREQRRAAVGRSHFPDLTIHGIILIRGGVAVGIGDTGEVAVGVVGVSGGGSAKPSLVDSKYLHRPLIPCEKSHCHRVLD